MSRAGLLYHLQTIDLEIDERSRRLREVEASLGESEELRRARRALQEEETRLRQWRRKLRDLELEMEGLNDKIASVEEQLYGGHVRNPKELASLQQEVEYLRRRRGELEEQVLEAMIEVEEGEARAAKRRRELAEVEADWQRAQASLAAERDELKDRLSQLRERRAELERRIGADDLALYEDLRRRKGGQAVALIRDGLCQGCGVMLPLSRARQARQGDELVLCVNCERILCAEPIPPSEQRW